MLSSVVLSVKRNYIHFHNTGVLAVRLFLASASLVSRQFEFLSGIVFSSKQIYFTIVCLIPLPVSPEAPFSPQIEHK